MIRQKGKSYYYEFMEDGKRYSGTCKGCTTKKEAEKFEKKMRVLLREAVAQKSPKAFLENFRDQLTGGKPILLDEAFDLYLQKPARRKAAPKQIKTNRTYWNDFLAFMSSTHSSVKRLSQVTRQQAEAYVTHLREHGPFDRTITATSAKGKTCAYTTKAEQLAPRTVNKRHKAIKAVFTRLAEDAGLLSNPFDIPTLKNDSVTREIFTQEEILLIGNNMSMPITKPVFTIGFCTGLTLGDICLLKWDEIEGNWITNKRRRKTGSKLEIGILPPLAEFLMEQRNKGVDKVSEYVVPELAQMYTEHESVVHSCIKKFLSSLGIKTEIKQAGRRAVSVKAAHAMRHTFACFAGMYGLPLQMVQNILGHMTQEMTLMYQKHSQRDEMERLLEKLPNFFQPPKNSASRLMVDEEPERKELIWLAETLPIEDVRELLAFLSRSHNQVIELSQTPSLNSSTGTSDTGSPSSCTDEESLEFPDLFQWAESLQQDQKLSY